jgi:replicative DNA helicase
MPVIEASARLLRGILDFGTDLPTPETRAANYERLKASRLDWVREDDSRIVRFIEEFFLEHLEIPSAITIHEHFEDRNDLEVLERMKVVGRSRVYDRAGYTHFLQRTVEERNNIRASALLKETQQIIEQGKVVREGREDKTLKGVRDAFLYFNKHILEILPSEQNSKTIGDLREDTEVAWKDYQTAKMNKDKAYGRFTGFQVVDETCHGCKRGELWIHAGFTGDGKTSLALNWAYNTATHYRGHVLYVSLEETYNQIRNKIYSMHSSNWRFKEDGKNPLDYRKIREGELDHDEETFYHHLLQDFETNPEYCRFRVWQPDRDVNMDDVRLHAELVHKEMELGLLIIDHSGLVEPRRNYREYSVALNSVIRDAKKLALQFNGGEGLAVCLLHQINRQGRDAAEKNGGIYKLSALSYANEAERSADYVTATFLDEKRREEGTIQIANLKNRDNKPFDPVTLSIDFSCRRIRNLDASELNHMSVDDHDDILAQVGM